MTDKKDEKKPLDMTTEEAINFLFPKEVVDELNRIANPPPKESKSSKQKSEVVDKSPHKNITK
jgi:hypothetical protein